MAGFLGSTVPIWDAAPLYPTLDTPILKRDMLVNNVPLGESLAASFASNAPTNTTASEERAEEQPGHTVVLMRRHGFTVQAPSLEMAVYRAIYTKINAKAQTGAMAVARDWGRGGVGGNDHGKQQELGLTEELVVGCGEMNERFQ